MMNSMLLPAFDTPVDDAQSVFRLALSAMSEPGTIHDTAHSLALDELAPATYALCLTLLDRDTPLWLAPELDTQQVRTNLAFHCGCPVVSDPAKAAFALFTPESLDAISWLYTGTDRDPHTSCSAIIQLDSLEGGQASSWYGPGILERRSMRLPLPEMFWSLRGASAFPRGLDFLFTAGQRIAGLPRSTRVLHAVKENR